MRWIGVALVSMAAVFAGGACGGESAPTAPKEASEEPAKIEEVAEKKEQGSEEKDATLDCQLAKAEAEMGAAGVEGLVAEWHMQEVEPLLEEDLSSAVAEAEDLRTFLAKRGYVC